jgi:hypothetical protein
MAKRKRVGRPPKPPEERRRGHITFRTTDKLREQLQDAAGAIGRSISEEVEIRLLQSFRDQYIAEIAANAAMRVYEEREVAKELTSKKIQEDKS